MSRWSVRLLLFVVLGAVLGWESVRAGESGYALLTEKAFLPPDFDQETFYAAWKYWPEKLRARAERATEDERRAMAFERYGLTARPSDPTKPLQYVVDESGKWTMNCFACHGGSIPAGRGGNVAYPGAPNSYFALQTLTEETRLAKVDLQKALTRMDLGSVLVPLGSSNGTTNAVTFGVLLLSARDADLNVYKNRPLPKMTHHDMDAPPWWHFKRKKMIYSDGFAEKGHRGLMQFLLVPTNGPDKFRSWEDDFRSIYSYIMSVEAPRYPFAIDGSLAERGQVAFSRVCAECHGTYGKGGSYPERRVPMEEVGTDPVRLTGFTPAQRAAYGKSWFAHYGKLSAIEDPGGYVAPPLDGIWASGPYFHNGSVPTLWHVLHPGERPVVWTRTGDFDQSRVGPAVETLAEMPADVKEGWEKRQYFDTRRFGKSAAGHEFPEQLLEDEKRAVLEYLKTL